MAFFSKIGGVWSPTFNIARAIVPASQIVLRGKAWIGNAAFSRDGTRVIAQVNAARTEDNGTWIWDIHKTDPLAVLQHTNISHAVFSPDGKRAATTSADKTARIWNVETSAVILTLTGHEDRVVWAEFSPDGTLIATASWDQTARVWDAQTGAQRMVLRGHNGKVHSVTFSPDGKRILTAGDDKTARIEIADAGQIIKARIDAPIAKRRRVARAPLFPGHGDRNIKSSRGRRISIGTPAGRSYRDAQP